MVRQKFSAVVDKNVVKPDLSSPRTPFDAENLGQFVKVKSTSDVSSISVEWGLPNYESYAD
jgi:hypothetical protein